MFEQIRAFVERLTALDVCAWLLALGALVVLVLLVWALLWLIIETWQLALRKQVGREYGLTLRRSVRVRRNFGRSAENRFELDYPYWRYAKRDGTRDRRRTENELIRPWSRLDLAGYRLRSRSPIEIYRAVNQCRAAGHHVNWSDEEIAKGKLAAKQARLNRAKVTAAMIADAYADRPAEFEHYCADLFRAYGYQATVTPPSRDGGYDIELVGNGQRYLVECKCFQPTATVGRPHLQKLVGANATVGAEGLIFVTTAGFTADARVYAAASQVELIDGKRLSAMARESSPTQSAPIPDGAVALSRDELLRHYPADVGG